MRFQNVLGGEVQLCPHPYDIEQIQKIMIMKLQNVLGGEVQLCHDPYDIEQIQKR